MKTTHRFILSALAVGAAATISLTQSGRCADIEWDIDSGTPGAQGGNGIWSSVVGSDAWWDGSTNVNFADGDSVTFGGAAGTIRIFGTVATPSITINSGYTIKSYTIDFGTTAGGGLIDSTSLGVLGADVTVSSALAGTTGLTIAAHGDAASNDGGGAARFNLSGTNTFNGGLTVTSGVVDWNSDASFGDAANTITLDGGGILWSQGTATTLARDIVVGASGGTVRLDDGADAVDFTGTLTSVVSTTLRRTDSGSLTMTADGSGFTGTWLNGGGDTSFTTLDWSGTDFDVQGGQVFFDGGGTHTIKSLATGANVHITADSVLDVLDGTVALDGGTLQDGGKLTSTSGMISIDVSGTSQIDNVIEDGGGALAVVLTGTGSVQINGVNTYTGGTTVTGARFQAGNSSAFGAGDVTVNSTGQAYLVGAYSNNFAIAGDGWVEGAGELGAIRFENGTEISGNVTVDASGARLLARGATGTISGSLLGVGDLEINNADAANNGTINIIGDASTYTGTVTLSLGTLNAGALGGGLTVGAGTANISGAVAGSTTLNGGTLNLNVGTTISGLTIGGGTLNVNSGATVNGGIDTNQAPMDAVGLGGTVTGDVFIDSGISLGLAGGSVSGKLEIGSDGASTNDLNFTGTLGVTGNLTLHGAHTVFLNKIPAPGAPVSLFTYGGTASDPDDGDLLGNFTLDGVAGYRSVAFANPAGSITVDLGGETSKWVGNDATNPSFWDSATTSNWSSSDNLFFNGDALTFDDTASSFTVDMQNDLSPSSVTVGNTTNDYIIGGTGFGITGSTGITKTGTGMLTLGGTTNSYTGAVDIQAGVFMAGTWESLGNSSGVTIAPGAQLDINGKNLGAGIRSYSVTIAGDGPDGLGALTNSNAGGPASNAGIHNLTLSADASLGGDGGRFDIGMANGFGIGTINGNGHTLTKVGTDTVNMRGDASGSAIDIVVAGGSLVAENSDNAFGGATGTVTVQDGARAGTYDNRTIATPLTLETGATLHNAGIGTGTWSGTITAANDSIIDAGNLVIISGTLNAAGDIAKTGGNVLAVTGIASIIGDIDVQAGTLQVGNVGATGSIGTPGSITLTNDGLALSYRMSGADASLSAPVTFGQVNSELRQHADTEADKLTLADTVGTDTTMGIVRSSGGNLVFGSSATGQFNQLAVGSLNAGQTAYTTIEDGADLTLRYLNIGDGGDRLATVNQTGGTVTMEAGGNGIRIGHLAGMGREYNLSGGTLDATALAANTGEAAWVNMGWDGEGDMSVGGGAGTATLLAPGLRFDRDRVDAGSSASAITILDNGVVEVGSLGTQGQGIDDGVVMSGGLIRGMADATWAARMEAATGTNSSLDIGTGLTIDQSGVLLGDGGLDKTGDGTLALSNDTNTYTGATTVSAGTLLVNGNHAGMIAVNGGTLAGTGTITGAITVNAGGMLGAGSSPGTLTVGDTTINGAVVLDLDASNSNSVDNDLIVVDGALIFGAGSAIAPRFNGEATSGVLQTYTLMTYSGTLSGTPTLDNRFYTNSRPPATALHLGAGSVTLDVTFNTAFLTWSDSPVNANWDVNTSRNWDNTGTSDEFFQSDSVTFDGTGDNTAPIEIAASVAPGNLTVDADIDYTFQGSGAIAGGTGLNKFGLGTLTILTDNTFTGAVNIQAGTVVVGDGGTTGTLGGSGDITVALGTELAFNRSDDIAPGRAFIDGGLVSIDGGGSLTTVADNIADFEIHNGTLFARGGDIDNSWAGSAIVMIHNGGTLDSVTDSMGGIGAALPNEIKIEQGGTWLLNGEQFLPNDAINLTGGLITGAGTIVGGGQVNHTGDVTSTIATDVDLNGEITFDVADGSQATDMEISGTVTSFGDLTKVGAGTLVLSGEQMSTGIITVDEGILAFSGLGSVVIGNGLAGAGTIINETGGPMLLSGDGSGFTGTINANGQEIQLSGPTAGPGAGGTIALNGGTLSLGGTVHGSLFHGSLSGGNSPNTAPLPGGSELTATASVIQGAIPAKTTLAIDGEIWLPAGEWSFSKTCDDGGYVAIDGQVLINNSNYVDTVFGTFTAPADDWYSFTARVSNGGGASGPNGAPFSIGIYQGLSTNINDYISFEIGALGTRCRAVAQIGTTYMAGGLTLGGDTANTVRIDDGELIIDGPVDGGAADELLKTGTGTLTLNEVGTLTGPVTVRQGTLVIGATGSIASASSLTVNSGAVLAGDGVCGAAIVHGKVSPGTGIGSLSTGNLDFMPSSSFNSEINSNAGTADKVIVTGDITIDETAVMFPADLGSSVLPDGTKLVLVEYTGTLTGAFAGRPEGSNVVLGANTFKLSYIDNGGTAVTLSIGGSIGTDYDTWADSFGLAGTDRLGTADPDNDTVINDDEYAFGLDPTNPASATPVTAGLDRSTGIFTYTRRDPALTGLEFMVETSTNLSVWTNDAGAVQTVVGTAGNVQTVNVEVSAALLNNPKLFVRAVTGSGSGAGDYETWAGGFGLDPATDGAPDADPDGDRLPNKDEYAFGLDPTDPASLNPVTVGFNPATGTFTYTRRDPALTGLGYTIETSTDLATWPVDAGAVQNVVGTSGAVQTVEVTVSAGLLVNPMLFVRPVAN